MHDRPEGPGVAGAFVDGPSQASEILSDSARKNRLDSLKSDEDYLRRRARIETADQAQVGPKIARGIDPGYNNVRDRVRRASIDAEAAMTRCRAASTAEQVFYEHPELANLIDALLTLGILH